MTPLATWSILATAAGVVWWMAREIRNAPLIDDHPDAHDADCTGPCCDPGADDLEAVARVTGLIVWPGVPDVEALAYAALIDRCIDRLVEGETCPDYVDEIKWGAL